MFYEFDSNSNWLETEVNLHVTDDKLNHACKN